MVPTPKQMLDAGVHYGHQTKHWHPNMEKYIYTKASGIHVIDLLKTHEALSKAADDLKAFAQQGKRIIFIGTKPQSKETVEIEAKRSGALYVTERWIGGTLTNFDEIKKNRDKLVSLKSKLESGEFDKLTKKERLLISREIEKLTINFGGLLGLTEQPAAVFVVDGRREKTAIRECNALGVPVYALVDTNTDPEGIDCVIPGNDDAIKSVALIVRTIADSILDGYKNVKATIPKTSLDTSEELSAKTVNMLKSAGVKSIEMLEQMSDKELDDIDGMSEKARKEIKKHFE